MRGWLAKLARFRETARALGVGCVVRSAPLDAFASASRIPFDVVGVVVLSAKWRRWTMENSITGSVTRNSGALASLNLRKSALEAF